MKPFDIQEATLKIGGVQLEAGNTGVVIPGVTRASSYRVEEVEDTADQTIQWNPSLPIYVIDNAELTRLYGDTRSNVYQAATYIVQLDDNGYIDELNVDNTGAFDAGDKTVVEQNTLSCTQVADPFGSFNINDWQQVPFRAKLRAGEIENIGGGSNNNHIEYTDNETEYTSTLDLTYDFLVDTENSHANFYGTGEWNIGSNNKNTKIFSTNEVAPEYQDVVIMAGSQNNNWMFARTGNLELPSGGDITRDGVSVLGGTSNGLAPVITKTSNSEALLTGTLHLGKAAGGSITEWDSEYNTHVWFNGTTGDNAGRKYAVGNDDYNNAFVVCFDTDGALVWKYSFDQIDMNPMGQGMQQVYPLTVKHRNGEGTDEFIYVGYDCGPYCGAVQFDLSGNVQNQWFYTHDQDPNNASLDHHALEVDNNGNPILLGRAYGEWITYNNVTAQTGTSVGDNILVFNRSDLGNVTDLGPWMTSNWQIDIDGTGNWYQPSNYSVNAFRSVPITTVTGNGGHHTLIEGTAYTTGAIAIDATGTPFLTIDAALWTNTAERDAILAHSSNTDYVFKCAVGSLYQFTTSEGWTNTTGSIWTTQGSFSTVQGDSLSALTNISEFNYGGTATINVYFYINNNGVTELNGQDVIFPGAGYNDGDTFKVLGSLLGGRDGGFITGLNAVQPPVGNTWYFAQNDLPTMNVDIPVGTYIRFGWTSAVGEVVSISDLGDGNWTVETSLISGVAATGGSVEFWAGNDVTGYRNWGYFYVNGGMPVQNKVRFYMDQSIADVPTYNVRASSGGQAFVIANNYTHTFGGSGNEGFNSASFDSVNNILYAQGDFNLSGNDYLIIAIDHSNGDVLWQKNYDDGSGGAYAKGIVADGANNCVYVSWENDNGEVILGKISKLGDLIWATHQERFNNWNDPPQPLVDSNGDVYLCGQINQYDPNQNSWEEELVVIKLSGGDAALIWSNSLTRVTVRTSVYEYYDTDATPFTMVNDKIYFGGYIYDRQTNYSVGLAISIPTDGSGLGSNGDWEYHAFPNEWMINDNGGNTISFSDWTNDITLTAQNVPHPDALAMTLSPFESTISNNAPTWLVRAETIGGNSKLTFEDGSEFGHVGIARHSVNNGGGNDIWLNADMNGKFIYFGDNPNYNSSTIRIPANYDTALPIGYTVTAITNQFSSQSVYVNNDGNGDVQILANGNSNTGNYWWGFAGDGVPGIYTIMKVDTNVWMLAGPNVWTD